MKQCTHAPERLELKFSPKCIHTVHGTHLKDVDKSLADNLPLRLRLGAAVEQGQEPVLRVHTVQVDPELLLRDTQTTNVGGEGDGRSVAAAAEEDNSKCCTGGAILARTTFSPPSLKAVSQASNFFLRIVSAAVDQC